MLVLLVHTKVVRILAIIVKLCLLLIPSPKCVTWCSCHPPAPLYYATGSLLISGATLSFDKPCRRRHRIKSDDFMWYGWKLQGMTSWTCSKMLPMPGVRVWKKLDFLHDLNVKSGSQVALPSFLMLWGIDQHLRWMTYSLEVRWQGLCRRGRQSITTQCSPSVFQVVVFFFKLIQNLPGKKNEGMWPARISLFFLGKLFFRVRNELWLGPNFMFYICIFTFCELGLP